MKAFMAFDAGMNDQSQLSTKRKRENCAEWKSFHSIKLFKTKLKDFPFRQEGRRKTSHLTMK